MELTYRQQLILETPIIEPDMRIAQSVMDTPYITTEIDPYGSLLWWSLARAKVHMIRVDAIIYATELVDDEIHKPG